MPKIKAAYECVVCGKSDEWMLGLTAVDKDGKKVIVKMCFRCLAQKCNKEVGEQE